MILYKYLLPLFAVFTFSALHAQNIYLKNAPPKAESVFDNFLYDFWQKEKITPALEASDCVMVRRLYIDLVGRVPTPAEASSYLGDKRPQKQKMLVQKLLTSEECAMFMTMRFGDELRIKSEFPINLWPNAAYLYTQTIYNALRTNMPYDKLASALILADGSNFRNGYVNFLRAVSKKQPQEIADAASKFLIGKSFAQLSAEEKEQFLNAFSAIRFKSTREWKEEIVYSILPGSADLRAPLIKDVIQQEAFAQNGVRRVWRWIYGSDMVDERIIQHLAGEFRKNGYNLRLLMQKICTSAAYRVGSLCEGDYVVMKKAAAVYPIRRLDAEVLADSIAQISGQIYTYLSVIPEPFSYYNNRAAALPDGSVTDQFLMLFGRPSRDSGVPEERKSIITAEQRLFLFNSGDLNRRLSNIHRAHLRTVKDRFAGLYMLFYSRPPTKEERKIFREMSKKNNQLFGRMPWVLVNSKEFLYQH